MPQASGHSIWLRPQRGGRGPAPEYTRDSIAAAGVALADADGLPAVTMRAVALALGTGPASLYRYVATRDEILELMVDAVNGECDRSRAGTGVWMTDLLELARQNRDIYLRHPWLLDLSGLQDAIGPNAVDYLECALAALAGLDVPARTKLEAIAVCGSVVAALARAEIAQRRAGRSLPQWQEAQAAYLAHVVAAGEHPQLAAALATQEGGGAPRESPGPLFDRVIARVLTGLLQPEGAADTEGAAHAP